MLRLGKFSRNATDADVENQVCIVVVVAQKKKKKKKEHTHIFNRIFRLFFFRCDSCRRTPAKARM